jgi:hypothetical protein
LIPQVFATRSGGKPSDLLHRELQDLLFLVHLQPLQHAIWISIQDQM